MLNLGEYAGQTVQIAFRFQSNSDRSVAAGYYVDDVAVVSGPYTIDIVNRTESFESGLGDWHADNGTWQVGVPTSGPGKAYRGQNCAGTVLGGDHSRFVDSRLVSPRFVVPPASENPRLSFWHSWDSYREDPGSVQIRQVGGPWSTISPSFSWISPWTRTMLDLSAYAGQTVQIAFRFQSNSDEFVDHGYYVDDVQVVTGPYTIDLVNRTESFESGLGDWHADNGTWQVGVPTSGPGKAFRGQNCAGTVLGGDHSRFVDSRLVSPRFVVPPASENPRLSFWHSWDSYREDPGSVQIRQVGGSWSTISPSFSWISPWTRTMLDLSAYAGQTVQIAFRFQSNSDEFVDHGYYVDEVQVVTGPYTIDLVNRTESFESGVGDWHADNGTWQVGVPTSGPGKAFRGQNCGGTVLGGDHSRFVDSRLVSPRFVVPPASENPRLSFWHSWDSYREDPGSVQIRRVGGPWSTISPVYSGNSPWTRAMLDLNAYAGEKVQIAFRFQSNSDRSVADGYYVDDVQVVTGPYRIDLVNRTESFEAGLGDWHADNGTWQVGVPTSGPGQAYRGRNCAGTVLSGTYTRDVNSRFVSPWFVVPCSAASPAFQFWQWFDLAAGDEGIVEIREYRSVWRGISPAFTVRGSSGGTWTPGFLDLNPYDGKVIQVGFRLRSQSNSPGKPGWYLDDMRMRADVLTDPPPQIIVETNLLTVPITANCAGLEFSLGPGAPEGAKIDPILGIFTWVPEEAHGPGSYEITINVNHPGEIIAPLASTILKVTVLEINSPPRLDPIETKILRANEQIKFIVTAIDPDFPVKQKLSFSLDTPVPDGARIDAVTGEFSWIPTEEQAAVSHVITVRVTDSGYLVAEAPPDGASPSSSTITFTAGPARNGPPLRVSVRFSDTGRLLLVMDGGLNGVDYHIQSTAELRSPANVIEWKTLKTVRPDQQPFTFEDTEAAALPARFYRVVQGQ